MLIATTTLALSLTIVALRPSPAQAQTVVTVINLPAVVIDNQCNGEPVALSGQLLTVVTTHPTPNGGTTVRSVSVTQRLKGTGLVSGVSDRAVEVSGTEPKVPAQSTPDVDPAIAPIRREVLDWGRLTRRPFVRNGAGTQLGQTGR